MYILFNEIESDDGEVYFFPKKKKLHNKHEKIIKTDHKIHEFKDYKEIQELFTFCRKIISAGDGGNNFTKRKFITDTEV